MVRNHSRKQDPGSTRGVRRDTVSTQCPKTLRLSMTTAVSLDLTWLTNNDRRLDDAEMHRLRKLQLQVLNGRKDRGQYLLRTWCRLVEYVLAVRLYRVDRVYLVLHRLVLRDSWVVVAMEHSSHSKRVYLQHHTNAESRCCITPGHRHCRLSV